MHKNSLIYIPGHQGLVGTALQKKLEDMGYKNILTRTRAELDLTDRAAVADFFTSERPEYVVDCAARVGGLKEKLAHPAEFLKDNIDMQNNLLWSAKEVGVKKFIFISSATVYPIGLDEPIGEDKLLTGPLDKVNEAYALAKIGGIKLAEYLSKEYGVSFISCIPNNLYGENDDFNPETAQVLPALIARFHAAKEADAPTVTIWGSGNARREFMHVEDLANALAWLLEGDISATALNIGTGTDIPIGELAKKIKDVVGYTGELAFDTSKPDGAPRRLLDSSKIKELGWEASIDLDEGLRRTYSWFIKSANTSSK